MENDSIRASGTNTLIDLWLGGRMRSICISQEAIGAIVGFDQMTAMSDKERCEFVRTNLPLVMAAAQERLAADAECDSISIDAGQLPRPDGRAGERRAGDRRKSERRKAERPSGLPDRRRGDRRLSERRRPKPRQPS